MEEAERRDHRNIGRQNELFFFNNISPGSCFYFPDGAYVYNRLINFMCEELKCKGYQETITPNIFNLKLWKTSGHYKNYKEHMFILQVIGLRKLDSISIIILMKLKESLIKANTPLYPLFWKSIQKVTVDGKSIELVSGKNFFDALANIGLVVEEDIHEPLVDALGLPQIKSAISVDKLKSAIRKFVADEHLRKQAQELMNKGALEEDRGHRTIKERHDEQDKYYCFLIF